MYYVYMMSTDKKVGDKIVKKNKLLMSEDKK